MKARLDECSTSIASSGILQNLYSMRVTHYGHVKSYVILSSYQSSHFVNILMEKFRWRPLKFIGYSEISK
jgi:hypothetical protein